MPPEPPHPDRPKVEPALPYEAQTAGVTRGGFRLLLVLTFINTILLGVNLMGPQSWQAIRGAYNDWETRREQAKAEAQRAAQFQAALAQARTLTFPEGDVRYTEAAEEAMRLLADGKRYETINVSSSGGGAGPPRWQAPVVAFPPAALKGLRRISASGLLLAHQRTAPGGREALVVAFVEPAFVFKKAGNSVGGFTDWTYHLSKRRRVRAAVCVPDPERKFEIAVEGHFGLDLVLPDSSARAVATVREPFSPGPTAAPATQPVATDLGHTLRLFGGSADPADASHFTIPYELDGQPGVIDGWLRDDGIVLRPRVGRAIAGADGPAWELVPTTAPAVAGAAPGDGDAQP